MSILQIARMQTRPDYYHVVVDVKIAEKECKKIKGVHNNQMAHQA